MPGAREVLQFVLTADASSAIRGFESVELSAEKSLGAAETRMSSFSSKATKFGAAGLAFSGLALVGLGKLAHLSSEAENNLNKLKVAAGHATQDIDIKALQNLNEELQQSTKFKADEMFGGQALLANIGLTTKQIEELTPLIADLAARWGKSFDDAAKAVGKAVNGSEGPLKKMGVFLKDTDGKAGGFKDTVDALANSVGGFAEQQGATFEGKLTILRNNLKELGENVGKGAADTLSSIAGGIADLGGAANKASPAVLTMIGSAATWGAIGIAGLSAMSLIAGGATRAAAALAATNVELVTAEGTLTAVGYAAAGLGGVLLGIPLFSTLSAGINAANGVLDTFQQGLDETKIQAAKAHPSLEKLADSFAKSAKAQQDTLRFSTLWEQWGDSVQVSMEGVKDGGKGIQQAFLDQQVSAENAQRALDAMTPKQALLTLDALQKVTNEITNNNDQRAANQRFIDENRKAIEKHAEAQAADAKSTKDTTDAGSEQVTTLENVTAAMGKAADAAKTYAADQKAAAAGGKAFTDALDASSNADEAITSIQKLGDAYRDLTTRGKEGIDLSSLKTLGADLANLDFTKLSDGQSKALSATQAYLAAARDELGALEANGASTDTINAKAAQYALTLLDVGKKANLTTEQMNNLLAAYGLTPDTIQTAVQLSGVEKAKFELELWKTQLAEVDPEVLTKLQADLDKGDWPQFEKDLKAGVTVPVHLDANAAKAQLHEIKDRATSPRSAAPASSSSSPAGRAAGAVTYVDNRSITNNVHNPPGTRDTLKGLRRAMKLNGDTLRKQLAL